MKHIEQKESICINRKGKRSMANKYTGEKCIVCGEEFKEDDELVVCPDCGTPYHKKCWPEDDICVNQALHEKGEEWKPSPKIKYGQGAETIRCMYCGTDNPAGQNFCGECGRPLRGLRADEERPFNNMPNMNTTPGDGEDSESGIHGQTPLITQIKLTAQSDLDGIKLGDFFDYIGNRSINLITNFVKFAKTGAKVSFNIVAFFFPEFYFFYRRMTKQGFLFLLLTFLLNIPTLILYGQMGTLGQVFFTTSLNVKSTEFQTILDMCSLANLSLQIFAAVFANYWYYRKARKDITAIRASFGETEPDIKTKEKIRGAGGTSWSAVIGAAAGELILTLGFLLVMSYLY